MLNRFLTTSIFLIAVLLPIFLGWGFDDWKGYFTSPARSALVDLAILGAVIAFILGIDLRPLRPGRLPTGSQSLELLVLTVASVGLVWFLPFADRRQIFSLGRSQLYRYAGLLLCGGGIVIRLAALAKIGKQFSAYVTLQQDHQLVTTGIYGVVRHPLYLSLLLAGPGFALVFASRIVWPVLGTAAAFIAIRIRQEERLLATEFGLSYDEYRGRTCTLLPPIL
jgi:protein-S-isoprenylcysteine O-methyltransferase Ste14